MPAARQHQIIEMVRNRFKNGHHLPLQFLTGRILKQLADKRNIDRTKVRDYLEPLTESAVEIKAVERLDEIETDHWDVFLHEELQLRAYFNRRTYTSLVTEIAQGKKPNTNMKQRLVNQQHWTQESDEVGDPPKYLIDGRDRVVTRQKIVHRMGQGGQSRLATKFVMSMLSSFLSGTCHCNATPSFIRVANKLIENRRTVVVFSFVVRSFSDAFNFENSVEKVYVHLITNWWCNIGSKEGKADPKRGT